MNILDKLKWSYRNWNLFTLCSASNQTHSHTHTKTLRNPLWCYRVIIPRSSDEQNGDALRFKCWALGADAVAAEIKWKSTRTQSQRKELETGNLCIYWHLRPYPNVDRPLRQLGFLTSTRIILFPTQQKCTPADRGAAVSSLGFPSSASSDLLLLSLAACAFWKWPPVVVTAQFSSAAPRMETLLLQLVGDCWGDCHMVFFIYISDRSSIQILSLS